MDGVESIRALAAFEAGVIDGVRAAVVEVAHRVEAGAKARAPVRTGTLRRSIRVYGPTSLGRGRYEALIGPTVIYGRRVELGFVGTDSIGRHYDQQGRPYLEPAFAATMTEASAIFARAVGSAHA